MLAQRSQIRHYTLIPLGKTVVTKCRNRLAELQIRWSTEENSKIIFLFLNENICCDPSLEPSR